MKIPFFWTLLLVLSLGACIQHKPGAGMYFYAPVADGQEHPDTALNLASFLQLRPDGSFSEDFGRYDYGNWNLKDGRLYLTNQHRRTYVYRVLSFTRTELDLRMDSGRTGHFRTHAMPSSQAAKDPFSLVNNQWRIPAIHKESDAEIRQRLRNHCQFWEVYFRWADTENENTSGIGDFPSPMKIYGNGFGLKHFDNLPQTWRSCFFDEEDCHKADTMIKRTFRRNKINWPKTDNDLQKMISGFQQLQEQLR